jgi:hypothetical protein
MGSSKGYRSLAALVLALACLGLLVPALASAASAEYTLNERLSLTGDCSTSPGVDEEPDPDCPYPAPPNGPSGRFDRPTGVAVDEWGNLYVASRSGDGTEGRIDIFDSEGHFISELDNPNGPQSIAVDGAGNLYAYESLIGVPGAPEGGVFRYPPDVYNPAAGEISYDPADRTKIFTQFGSFGVAVDRRSPLTPADDHLYVGAHEEIREYGPAGEGNPLKTTIKPAGLKFSAYIALDAQRRLLYTQRCENAASFQCVVWALELDSPYGLVKEIKRPGPGTGKFASGQGDIALAADEINGHLFVGDLANDNDIYEFDAEDDYSLVSQFQLPGGALVGGVQAAVANNHKDPDPENLNKDDNYRHLFVPIGPAVPSGSVIAFAPPEIGPPTVSAPAAVGIASSEAELEAMIHPGQLETSYEIQYVSEAQFAIDEWQSAQLAGSGTLAASNKKQRVSAPVTGLSPDTAYRFRVVAENTEGEDEDGVAFTTYNDAPITPPGLCPNGALLTGPSAILPDCRAYELVSPADTNGAGLKGAGFEGDRFAMVQSRPDGLGVSFELLSGSLPGTEASGGFHGDPYLATRTAAGWSTTMAGPTSAQTTEPQPGSLSPDQGHSFWIANKAGSALVEGKSAHYIRYPDGHSELIGRGSLDTEPRALGRLITENATHIVFETTDSTGDEAQLEPAAPPTGTGAVYDRTSDEVTHVVSLLPGDITPSQPASYLGASADGEGIAFGIAGTMYLRKDNATTYEIEAGLISAKEFLEGKEGLNFAGVSAGGERIFYVKDGDLEAFDTETEDVITFADTAARVVPVNVAPQGDRAYFVSEDAIPGSGPNPNGAEPQAGEQNLYLSEGETTPTFIATVTERDVEGIPTGTGTQLDGLGLWLDALEKRQTPTDPSRTNSAGDVFLFSSRANLDDYDSGEFPQVYRYELEEDRLQCLSCPPTGALASGGALLQSIFGIGIAPPLSRYGLVPSLALEGERVFFESTEALVSGDVNGRRDVYEWEEEGVGSCEDRPGGCIYLISSGRGAKDSYLFGHSQSGDDVFFTTNDILVEGDEATRSIYDARVGGGFARAEAVPCEGEECRPVITPPPALPNPQSGAGIKSGNLTPAKRCPRGKHKVKRKGKVICVKKHKKHRKAAKRRASR